MFLMKKFGNHLFNFIKGLFSPTSDVSSKRVVGFGSFMVLVVAVPVYYFFKIALPEFMWYGFIGLVIACFGLNTFISHAAIKGKAQVASDIAKENPDPPNQQIAMDVITNTHNE